MNTKSVSLTLPHEIVICLSRAEIYTADLILDLCRCTSKKIPSKALYACVGQKWLAERVGVTREWISKCVSKLSRLGILRITHRRKIAGIWKTNMYRAGDALKKGYHTAKRLFLLSKSHVNSGAHIGVKITTSSTEMRRASPFSSDMSRDELLAKIKRDRERSSFRDS